LMMPTNFLQYFLRFPWNLVNFGTAGVHKNLLRGCGFREYRHSESRTLHATVNEFLSVISIFLVRFTLEFPIRNLHIMLLVMLHVSLTPSQGRTYFRSVYQKL
jgi:hypothetical protein